MDATFFALVALILFFGILIYVKVPGMLATALDARAAKISAELDEARRLREEAESLLASYRKKAVEAEKEAAAIVAEAKAEAERMASETNKALEDMIVRRTKAAEAKIASAEAQAIADVRSRAVDIAVAAAGAVLADKVQGDVAASLVVKGIEEVGAKLN